MATDTLKSALELRHLAGLTGTSTCCPHYTILFSAFHLDSHYLTTHQAFIMQRAPPWKRIGGVMLWATIGGTLWLTSLDSVSGHVAVWHPGASAENSVEPSAKTPIAMYCLNGTSGGDDPNTNQMVNPLYQVRRNMYRVKLLYDNSIMIYH